LDEGGGPKVFSEDGDTSGSIGACGGGHHRSNGGRIVAKINGLRVPSRERSSRGYTRARTQSGPSNTDYDLLPTQARWYKEGYHGIIPAHDVRGGELPFSQPVNDSVTHGGQ